MQHFFVFHFFFNIAAVKVRLRVSGSANQLIHGLRTHVDVVLRTSVQFNVI